MSSASAKPRPRGVDRLTGEGHTYVASPKGVSDKHRKGEEKTDSAGRPLRRARRRLSVVSDNKFIEGVAEDAKGPDTDVSARSGTAVQSYAGVSKKGYAPYNPRKRNQDSIIMVEHDETGSLFLAALDGHGEAGDLVSQYFRDRLPRDLFAHSHFVTDPCRAMADCLANIERQVLADPSIDTEFSGSTAVLSVIRGDDMWVANVGDSRVIVGAQDDSGGIVAEPVSIDHKPDLPEEKARILATGGRVFAVEYDDGIDGPQRVWLAHMDIPGLAMSRSVGDTVAHSAGVSSEPELFHRKLTDRDRYIVMGSDGLWEFVENDEVIKITSAHGDPGKAVEALVEESYDRWMREEQVVDDTTVIVAFLGRD